MRTAILVAFVLAAAGCGGSAKPEPVAQGESKPTGGKPGVDEARAVILAYLGECGCQEVELQDLTEMERIPTEVRTPGQGWAYQFSFQFTSVLGDRSTARDWVAAVAWDAGELKVAGCLDSNRRALGRDGVANPVEPAVMGVGQSQ